MCIHNVAVHYITQRGVIRLSQRCDAVVIHRLDAGDIFLLKIVFNFVICGIYCLLKEFSK